MSERCYKCRHRNCRCKNKQEVNKENVNVNIEINGVTGPQGPPGIQGPQGPGAPINNGYFSFRTTNGSVQTVNPSNTFTFNNSITNGPMILTGSNTINVNASGTYVINYGVTGGVIEPGPGEPSIALKIGNFINPDTSISIFNGSAGVAPMISSSTIKNLVSTDTIQLVNSDLTPITTKPTSNVVAYVTIFQIS